MSKFLVCALCHVYVLRSTCLDAMLGSLIALYLLLMPLSCVLAFG